MATKYQLTVYITSADAPCQKQTLLQRTFVLDGRVSRETAVMNHVFCLFLYEVE